MNDAVIAWNGWAYTYDANGNMGARTYGGGTYTLTYGHANRLKSASEAGLVASYAYNGMGDRLQQTVNCATTSYTLDVAGGLTQVLSDGTHTYLYGNGRIALYTGMTAEYFLGDALDSVRQLADASGNVALAKGYEPYGEVRDSAVNAPTAYGFRGETTDSNGLIYLRARYYLPSQGRFISKDTWQGDYNRPLSLNDWNYVEGNPINFVDPIGLISVNEDRIAKAYVQDLLINYHVNVLIDWGFQPIPIPVPMPPGQTYGFMDNSCSWKKGEWTIDELHTLRTGVGSLSWAMGGTDKFFINIGGVTVSQDPIKERGLTWPHRIKFTSSPASIDTWTVVHELAHAWDGNFGWKLSKKLEEFTGGYTSLLSLAYKWLRGECDLNKRLPGCNNAGYFYAGNPPAGSDVNFNRFEDSAESVTAYVYPIEAQKKVEVYRYIKDY